MRNLLLVLSTTYVYKGSFPMISDLSNYFRNFSIKWGCCHCERSEAISFIARRLLRRQGFSQWQKVPVIVYYLKLLKNWHPS